MTIKDILDFAKAGYKPSDVKELMALAEPEQKEPEQKEPEQKEPEQKEPEQKEPDVPDYKKLYEESQKKLKAAQKANTQQNLASNEKEVTAEDILTDLAASFM